MFSPPVRASVCALYCALAACSETPPAGKPVPPVAPKYSVDRPVEGLPPPVVRDDSFKRGLSLALFVGEVPEAQRAPYAAFISQAAQLGATDLELVVQWAQLDGAAVELAPHANYTVDDDFLAWFMDQARAQNVRVMLTPVIELEQPAAAHRAIVPSDTTRWFWSYHRFALHYARIAEAHKATCYAVGADLPFELANDPQWTKVISDVRKAFKGKVSYVARPERVEELSIWNTLDVISVAGAGGRVKAHEKSQPELSALLKQLQALANTTGKPYQLTGVSPAEQAQSPLAQLDAARALYQALYADQAIAGLFVSIARPGSGGAPQTTPVVGSPYAQVLRHWYARPASKSN